VFNLGPTIVCNTEASTAARLLKSGKLIDACEELPKWNKARVAGQLVELPGLTTRRERERKLCLSVVL
jgi:GH24 family phage-related lysozyme (muramidase)